jgi:mono/diheme cytochrome c family protein
MKINSIFIVLIALMIASCGGSSKQNQESQKESAQETKSVENIEPSNAMLEHPGKEVYDAVCLACHMADGSGVPGMHPPLIKTEWVNGDKDRLIDLVLNGMEGEIEVDGEIYNSIMPPNSHLTDQQIADVITYIRQSFGNNSGEVTAEEVAKVRNAN